MMFAPDRRAVGQVTNFEGAGGTMARRLRHRTRWEDRDRFQWFLIEMAGVLDAFIEEAEEEGFRLDFSIDSLTDLERLIERNDDPDDDAFVNRAARYLGEVFRRNVGGNWTLHLRSPKSLSYRLPVLSGYAKRRRAFCPLLMITNYSMDPERGMLRKVIDAHLRKCREAA